MRNLVIVFLVLAVLLGNIFAGVKKKSKTEVQFKGFGKYSEKSVELISAEKKRKDSEKKFKGEGMMGKLLAKAFLKSGKEGEIIDLAEMKMYKMDHQEKEYTVTPIEKISLGESDSETSEGGMADAPKKTESSEKKESNVRIIRSEFYVTETGETKKIGGFKSEKYLVTWLTEWENIETQQRGIDSLSTIVWTTPLTEELKAATAEEQQFNQTYLKKIGIDTDEMKAEILGSNWMSMFSSMNKDQKSQSPQWEDSKFAQEMGKIKGYPVLIDGKYFMIRPSKEEVEQEEEEETDVTDVSKMFGRFAKKALKKKEKKPTGPVPAFAFRTEVLELKLTDLSEKEFQVPENYQLK